MTAVVFETPGLIDVRAFTIMGAHAKPNSAKPSSNCRNAWKR